MQNENPNLRSSVQRRATFPALVIVLAIALGGCADSEGVRVYKVAKSDMKPRIAIGGSATSVGQDQQMLAAIVPNGSSAWFFKLTGAPDKVGKNRDEFRLILESVKFASAGSPTWNLGDGWSEQLSQGMTYAKLSKDDDGLTATVTELPVPNASDEEAWHSYVAQNVNRWRGQLALQAQDWSAIESELEEVEQLSQGPVKAYFVSLVGKNSGGGMGGPMMGGAAMGGAGMLGPIQGEAAPNSETAQDENLLDENLLGEGDSSEPDAEQMNEPGDGGDTNAAPAQADADAELDSPFDFETPENWQQQDVSQSQFRLAAFAVASEGSNAEVTVVAAGGEAKANLGIWFGQIALEPSEAAVAAVLDAAETVEVNGVDASVYWLDGAEAESKQSILVADVPFGGGGSLFVKLKGDSQLVQLQRANFMAFLKSLTWSQ